MDTPPPESESARPKRIPNTKTKEYYRNYYHENMRNVFECPLCLSTVVGNNSKILKHFNTNKCGKASQNIQNALN